MRLYEPLGWCEIDRCEAGREDEAEEVGKSAELRTACGLAEWGRVGGWKGMSVDATFAA